MTSLKNKILCLTPMVLGLYCLIQGALLVMSENSMVQLVGLSMWLWLPGCAYYGWKGRHAFASQAVAVRVTIEQVESEDEMQSPGWLKPASSNAGSRPEVMA